MKTKYILIFAALSFFNCNEKEAASNRINPSGTVSKSKESVHTVKSDLKNQIIGVWTDADSENGVIEIKAKTIYYVDNFEEYGYMLKGNVITIHYPDYIYTASVRLAHDTLFMNSKEYGSRKFRRFKD